MKRRRRRQNFFLKSGSLVFGIVVFLLMSGACQQKPTKVNEPPPEAWTRLTEKAKLPLKLTDDTVVLDSRSEFDYGLGHWSGSVRFNWQDLLAEPRKLTELAEPRVAAQRLALLGIDPKTPVVVIGYGPGQKGNGDEGRLAWALMYYGVSDVQTVSVDGLDVYFTHQETPTHANRPVWVSDPRESMILDKTAFMKAVKSPRKSGKSSTFIIDVRTKEEYFSRNDGEYETPDIGAIQIEWREFFGGDGRPQKGIRRKLQGVGMKLDDPIILISNHGVRSSAASYALLALGFKRVSNFLGGWDSLKKK